MRRLVCLESLARIASWTVVATFLIAARHGCSSALAVVAVMALTSIGLEVYLFRRRLKTR